MNVGGELYPIRDTAYKSLLDRAKISGSALPKLRREKLADVLNSCLALYSSETLLLLRDEKVSAAHSGDATDYSNIGINKIDAMLRQPNCPFVLYIGTRKLVKRKEFEEFIHSKTSL